MANESMQYDLLPFSDPRLLTPPPEYLFDPTGDEVSPALSPTVLRDVLYEHMDRLGGIGLAANQIGLPYRVFVMGHGTNRQVIFNPEVVGVSDESVLMEEGCLSFPGFVLTLNRPREVTAAYMDETGTQKAGTFVGMGARVFLHEYDHMEGIVFTQRASKFKVDHEMKKYTKRVTKLLAKKGFTMKRKKKSS